MSHPRPALIPPALPPRRPSSPGPPAAAPVTQSSRVAAESPVRPPPLPSRSALATSTDVPLPSPLVVPNTVQNTSEMPRVDVTPATPPDAHFPDDIPMSIGQRAQTMEHITAIPGEPVKPEVSSQTPPAAADPPRRPISSFIASPVSTSTPTSTTRRRLSRSSPPQARDSPSPKPDPGAGPSPPPSSASTGPSSSGHGIGPSSTSSANVSSPFVPVFGNLPLTDLIIVGALLLNLFVGQLSFLWTILIAGGLYVWKVHGQQKTIPPENPIVEPSRGREAVEWVNHALYALFPLISTDVLTPFIDLLEDALVQQLPPVVTSVRLTSAALGAQPVVLTSLRPISDQEWFASLAPTTKPSGSKEGNRKSNSTSASKLGRSESSSSARSMLLPEDIEHEAVRRRKRDRVLQRVSRRRGQAGPSTTAPHNLQGVPKTGSGLGLEVQPGLTAEGEHGHLPEEETEMEQDDPNVGLYVNYQVGFEYRRDSAAKRKGWGLHVLAYFGWGVKGVAKSEVPVYIDVMYIKGMLNLRLLLSSTPPFARTATFSFTTLPVFDISAKPLRQGNFNAMDVPGMKTYVQKSIAEVAKAFVQPESYSIDIDRLLLGRESAMRTHSVGVLHVVIHSASDLPKTDTVGSCDPYIMICLSKFRKPVFSTRTIKDARFPIWEEEAFILVTADAIESGEHLLLRLADSDRFSADDSMGVVQADITDLVEQAESLDPQQGPVRRTDPLLAEQPGMKTSGYLDWSVRFCPIWSMPQEELEKRIEEKIQPREGEPSPEDGKLPAWLRWIDQFMDKPDWEADRAQRRKDTLALFTGDRGREELEAASPPRHELRSGVLQFHIHQCIDLEVDSLESEYSSSSNSRISAASGKPALAAEVDRTPAENPQPPSAYCEVHLNDRLVYRTRTKQVTPLPYFNAVSERFIRDWTMAKLVFVVRDERDREHDPILGLVVLYLRDVLKDRCQFTRWFPLCDGLGWGRIRISLLFKPIDIRLPPRISGYEVATLEITKFEATDLSYMTDRNLSVLIETESDRFIMKAAGDENFNRSSPSLSSSTPTGSPRSTDGIVPDPVQVAWEITKPIRLAVEYRHSSSVVISFVTRSKMMKTKKVFAVALARLNETADGETGSYTLPIFETSDVKSAIKGTNEWFSGRSPPTTASRRSSVSSRKSLKDDGPRMIGFVSVDFAVYPGISRAHRKVGKKDLRFAKVYEAWEAYRHSTRPARRDKSSDNKISSSSEIVLDQDDMGEDDTSSEEGDSDNDSLTRITSERFLGEEEKKTGFLADARAHSKALHKKHKGIFQLKIVRTGQLVKDKIEAKIRTSNEKDRRRGTDLHVEHEGQSSI